MGVNPYLCCMADKENYALPVVADMQGELVQLLLDVEKYVQKHKS